MWDITFITEKWCKAVPTFFCQVYLLRSFTVKQKKYPACLKRCKRDRYS